MTELSLLLKIGWRNLWRNPRGTLLTALALGVGLALLLISLGFLDGSHEQVIADAVRLGSGHVAIQAKGYQDAGSQELLLPGRGVSAGRGVPAHRGHEGYCARGESEGAGLWTASSAANAEGVSILGVVPREERAVSLIPQRIVAGAYLNDDGPSEVVLGTELARELEVKIGSKVVLRTQAVRTPGADAADRAEGEMQSTLLRVSGIFRTGLQAIDAHIIHVRLSESQALLGVPDQVTQIAILLAQEGDSQMVAKDLRQQLAGFPVEVLTWRESTPMLVQSFRLDEAFNYVMNGVVLAMVGLGIFNTILMRVLERRYEFGVCTALGLRPGQLAEMLIGESLGLTVISLAMGLALGLGIHHHFATAGLDLRGLFNTSLPTAFVFDPIIYPRLSLRRIAWSVSIVFMMATIMSFYPAPRRRERNCLTH